MNNTKNKCFNKVNFLSLLSGLSTTRFMSCLFTAWFCFRLACNGLQIVESFRY